MYTIQDIRTVIDNILKKSPIYTDIKVKDTINNIEELINLVERGDVIVRVFPFLFNSEPVTGIDVSNKDTDLLRSPSIASSNVFLLYDEKISVPALVSTISIPRLKKLPGYMVEFSKENGLIVLKTLESQLHYINEFLVQPFVNIISNGLDLPIAVAIEYIMPQMYKEITSEIVKSVPPEELERLKNLTTGEVQDTKKTSPLDNNPNTIKDEIPEASENIKVQKFTR